MHKPAPITDPNAWLLATTRFVTDEYRKHNGLPVAQDNISEPEPDLDASLQGVQAAMTEGAR